MDGKSQSMSPCHPGTLSPCLLIAGIGNIFFGDDAFGVEVVRAATNRAWPANVTIKDFGIRGYDLACALLEHETAILVDAIGRGGAPGTLHVLELDPTVDSDELTADMEMHRLDVVQVFRLVRQMEGRLPRLFLVGCEPATLEPSADLSEPVRRSVADAVSVIEQLVADWRTAHDRQ